MKNNKMNLVIILVLIILSGILVLDPILHRGIFTAHDITSNLTNFGAFYSSLTEGNIVPRWAGDIANLYGSPTIMFFYPLSYYLSSLIRFLGFSLIDTMKIYIFITFITSAIVMYLWLRSHVPRLAAFAGAFLYVYAPYRINDIYARGSVAENTAFVFIPLIAYMIYKIYEKPRIKRMIVLAFSIAALILSHPFLLVVFTPFYVIYMIFLGLNKKKILLIIIAGLLSIMLTVFYTLPLLNETKYTHYDLTAGKGYIVQFINFGELILPVWTFIDIYGKLEYQTYQIGILQMVLFLLSLAIFSFKVITQKDFKRLNLLYFIGLVNFIISVFLMLPISNIVYQLIPIIQKIEYPWRYLSLNLFGVALMTACLINTVKKSWLQKLLTFLIIIVGLILYLPHSKGHDYKLLTDKYYLYYIKENMDMFATLPRWAAQPDIYPRIEERFIVVEGDGQVKSIKRNSTQHVYNIEGESRLRIADATFYFPGCKVAIDGKPIEVEFQDPNYRGIITFHVPEGKHLVEVNFQRTKLRIFADTITFLSFIFIIILWRYAEKIQKSIHRYTGI